MNKNVQEHHTMILEARYTEMWNWTFHRFMKQAGNASTFNLPVAQYFKEKRYNEGAVTIYYTTAQR